MEEVLIGLVAGIVEFFAFVRPDSLGKFKRVCMFCNSVMLKND